MKKSYSDLLLDPRWQKKRLQILERDNFACQKCNDTENTLHVHHKKYINGKNPWEYNDDDLVTLCKDCHELIENVRKINSNFNVDNLNVFKAKNEYGCFISYGFVQRGNKGIVITITNPDGILTLFDLNYQNTLLFQNFLNKING